MKTDEVKLLVAIDIGTAHSGYSYSFLNNPGDVICSSFDGLTKTPTSVLVDKYGIHIIPLLTKGHIVGLWYCVQF